MKQLCLINGKQTDLLPVSDRGLQYGDGLFETISVINGKPLRWQRHMQRLTLGCDKLDLPCPDVQLLLDEATQLCQQICQETCQQSEKLVLKIIVTRGSGGRGYGYDADMAATRILQCYPWPDYSERDIESGVELRLSQTRLAQNVQLAGLKHLNRLEQVLARSEWSADKSEIYDAIMLDNNDNVIECTMHNLFFIKDKVLHTPDLSLCGVSGVIRDMIVEYYNNEGMDVQVHSFTLSELLAADEVFITNSLRGVIPVRKVNESLFSTWPQCEKISHFVQQSS